MVRYLRVLFILFILVLIPACASKKVIPPETPVASEEDPSLVAGIPVDPDDVKDYGEVHFLVVYGAAAQHYYTEWGETANLKFQQTEGGAVLVYLMPDMVAPSGEEVEMIGLYQFKVVTGKSAEKVLKALGQEGDILHINTSSKIAYLIQVSDARKMSI